jgi:enoyl-CoA hydratase
VNDLSREHFDAVCVLTINRPKAFNALTAQVVSDLVDAVNKAALDPAVHAVVITGVGDKAFSAGADLKELRTMDLQRAREVMTAGQHAFRDIETAAVPVITAVNGLALGGGFELVLASSFPVLSQNASLGLPEASLGLIPGYGGTQRLPDAIGFRAATHLMLTGARLSAGRAFDLGLTPVPPTAPDELMPTALDIARSISEKGPDAVRAILHAVQVGRDVSLDVGLAVETESAAVAIAGKESTEGITAFLEKRPASFDHSGKR